MINTPLHKHTFEGIDKDKVSQITIDHPRSPALLLYILGAVRNRGALYA